jgi:hypothetical protein
MKSYNSVMGRPDISAYTNNIFGYAAGLHNYIS